MPLPVAADLEGVGRWNAQGTKRPPRLNRSLPKTMAATGAVIGAESSPAAAAWVRQHPWKSAAHGIFFVKYLDSQQPVRVALSQAQDRVRPGERYEQTQRGSKLFRDDVSTSFITS